MTGTLMALHAEVGAAVAEGEPLFVVEAMKMEYVVRAPRDVVVASVDGAVGGAVQIGQAVVTFEPSESAPSEGSAS